MEKEYKRILQYLKENKSQNYSLRKNESSDSKNEHKESDDSNITETNLFDSKY